MRPQLSLLLGVRFLEKPIRVSAVPGFKVSPDPPNSASFQTQRTRVMGPRALLLLLSGVLVLTETRAGECGVGRERPLRGGTRGSPGGRGAGAAPHEGASPTPLPRPAPLPGPGLSLPCFPTPLLFPLRSSGPSSTASILLALRPLLPPGSITSDPGPSPRTRDPRREEVRPGLTPPRPQAPTP